MSDFGFLLLAFLAAVNPAASLASLPQRFADAPGEARARLAAVAGVLAGALLVLLALAGESLLDFLDVSPPSFDVAAGMVMMIGSARPLWRGRAIDEAAAGLVEAGWRAAFAPLAVPLLATPAALAAAIAYGQRNGEGETILAALLVLAVAVAAIVSLPAIRRALGSAILEALGRLGGALLLAIGVGLLVDGVLSI